MAYSTSILFKFSILLNVIFALKAREIAIFDRTVHLSIRDDIPRPTTLTIHCQSKNNDLGFYTLNSGGTYTFTFSPILVPRWVNTLFYCAFTWQGSPYRHFLDVYDQEINNCKYCNWTISKTGGCLNGKCQKWKRIKLIDANSTSKI